MQVRNLYFSYNPKVFVFKNLNFQSDARYVFFQGLSGCGKSTFLKLLSDSLVPDAGEIILPDNGSNRKCLIVQEDALFPWLTGRQNISALLPAIEAGAIEANIMYNYTRDFIDRKAYQLSFGQRRLIELFRVILLKPAFLCLDEPFNYLDEKSRQVVSDILFNKELFADTCQLIMTTHYASDITDVKTLSYELYYFNGMMPYAQFERKK